MCLRCRIVFGLAILISMVNCRAADSFTPRLATLFREAHAQKTDLARYEYLGHALLDSPPEDYSFTLQLYAFAENELGLYNEALRDYPLRSLAVDGLSLPDEGEWKAANAADAIAGAVTGRRLVKTGATARR